MKRKKRLLALLLMAAFVCWLISGCGTGAQSAASTPSSDQSDQTENVDTSAPPSNQPEQTEDADAPALNYETYAESDPGVAKDIVFLHGTWYDMGCQYAEQAPNSVIWQITNNVKAAKAEYGGFDAAWQALQTRYGYYEEKGPELLDFYRGISDASGFSYEETIVGYLYSTGSLCNAQTAWGDATQDGASYFAVNSDMVYLSEYLTPIMMMYPDDPAYPEDKYSFAYTNGRGFNCLGVVAGGTGGQGNLEGDDGDSGFATHREDMLIPARCATAEEAKDMFLSGYWIEGGYNFITIDSTGKSYVIEHTAQEDAIREPNQSVEGDRDYFIVTNGYVEEEMAEHLYTDGSFDDCPVRYETIKYYLEQDYGNINLDTFIKAQSSTTYIDPETGVMTSAPAWNNDLTSYFSPANVAPNEKTTDRLLIDCTNAVLYSLSGNQNTLLSALPNATGTYCRLNLAGTPEEIVSDAKNYAQLYLYQAERDISLSETVSDERYEYLNNAKEHLIKGDRYLVLAQYSSDEAESLRFYSLAATELTEAQCYAKAAWNNPYTAYSDYDNQFPY